MGSGFVWIGLHEPDEHQMQVVADVFGLHPLAVEDAVHAHQRPKLERYDDTLFLVLKTVNYVPHESISLTREIVETGEIMVFVGPQFVVTVRHGNFGGLVGLRKEMEAKPGHLGLGPYAVMHAVAQHVVDSYRDITTLIEADIDTVQDETFAAGRKTDIEQIYCRTRRPTKVCGSQSIPCNDEPPTATPRPVHREPAAAAAASRRTHPHRRAAPTASPAHDRSGRRTSPSDRAHTP